MEFTFREPCRARMWLPSPLWGQKVLRPNSLEQQCPQEWQKEITYPPPAAVTSSIGSGHREPTCGLFLVSLAQPVGSMRHLSSSPTCPKELWLVSIMSPWKAEDLWPGLEMWAFLGADSWKIPTKAESERDFFWAGGDSNPTAAVLTVWLCTWPLCVSVD